MGDITKDSRFTKLLNDPSYRQIPKSERKVKIDKRFQSMFDNEKFKIKYTIDKRGKPINQTSSENLKKYYDLSSEESDSSEDDDENEVSEKIPDEEVGKFVRPKETNDDKIEIENDCEVVKNDKLEIGEIDRNVKKKLRDLETDYARGEGVLFSDSSSEEEESDKEDDDVEHGWGELDADAETCNDATYRLAVCNMDWDNIKASDLFVLFNSFLPPGGSIKSVTIYPSEFGLKRMQEEEVRGPIELTETKKRDDSDDDSNDEENEEGSKYHMEKLRKYQLNRLKYYYAVIVFDSASTANKIYTDCDGIEYESSASKVDLRFIPDSEIFDQEIHEECTEAPEAGRYKPRLFTTTALQQAKVQLTWDSANPHRTEILKNAADGDVNNEDLKNYLACSSEEESNSNESDNEENLSEVEEKNDKLDPISKYKSLLSDIENIEKEKKNRNSEMEITWGLGLKEKTEELVKKKINKVDKLTPFEEMIEKQKLKKKAKKLERKKKQTPESDDEQNEYSSDDIPSDIDMNDPYFAEEFKGSEFKAKKKKIINKNDDDDDNQEEEDRKRAELELLLDDDENKSHFSLKKIQDFESDKKSKKKGKYKNKGKQDEVKSALPDFNVDVNDERFSAVFTSHLYNIDPNDPNFKKTKGMESLIQEKLKRRPAEVEHEESQIVNKKMKRDAAMSVLVNNIKRKTVHLNKK